MTERDPGTLSELETVILPNRVLLSFNTSSPHHTSAMKLGNLEVCIESGGQRLEEYSTETDGRQISCWVASEAGQVSQPLEQPWRI